MPRTIATVDPRNIEHILKSKVKNKIIHYAVQPTKNTFY
jgi:hypothetical protein